MLKKVSVAFSICAVFVVLLWATVGSKIDFATGTSPGSPVAGKVRLWGNSGSGLLECLTSSGGPCLAASSLSGPIGNNNYYGVVCSNFVVTAESTTSTIFINLATTDTCTFTLAATTMVVASYTSYVNNLNANTGDYSSIFGVDGTNVTASEFVQAPSGASDGNASNTGGYSVSLAAGSHTIIVQHKVYGSVTGKWQNRLLVASTSP